MDVLVQERDGKNCPKNVSFIFRTKACFICFTRQFLDTALHCRQVKQMKQIKITVLHAKNQRWFLEPNNCIFSRGSFDKENYYQIKMDDPFKYWNSLSSGKSPG